MEKFNRDKLNEFNMNRDSRPSDPENHENPFRPTDHNLSNDNNSYELDDHHKKNTNEGVDDYDGDTYGRKNHHNYKPFRSSLDNHSDFHNFSNR